MVAQTDSTPTPTYAKIKEWLTFASIIVVVAGGIAAGLLGGMKLVIAPLQTDIRAIHGRLDRMDGHIQGMDSHIRELDSHLRGLDHSTQTEFKAIRHTMQTEFKAVRQDISALNERLIRLETLLEQVIRQPDSPQ